MLLDGIFYGKIPISRGYKNGEIIWSLGEDNELVFHTAEESCFIAQATPEAARLIQREYELDLGYAVQVNVDESEQVLKHEYILEDSEALIKMQGQIGLSPLSMVYVFDIIGTTSPSQPISFYHMASSQGDISKPSVDDSKMLNNQLKQNLGADPRVVLDSSKNTEVIEKGVFGAFGQIDYLQSQLPKSDKAIKTGSLVYAEPTHSEVIFVHNLNKNYTEANLSKLLSRLFEFQNKSLLLTYLEGTSAKTSPATMKIPIQQEQQQDVNGVSLLAKNPEAAFSALIDDEAEGTILRTKTGKGEEHILIVEEGFLNSFDSQELIDYEKMRMGILGVYKIDHTKVVLEEYLLNVSGKEELHASKADDFNLNLTESILFHSNAGAPRSYNLPAESQIQFKNQADQTVAQLHGLDLPELLEIKPFALENNSLVTPLLPSQKALLRSRALITSGALGDAELAGVYTSKHFLELEKGKPKHLFGILDPKSDSELVVNKSKSQQVEKSQNLVLQNNVVLFIEPFLKDQLKKELTVSRLATLNINELLEMFFQTRWKNISAAEMVKGPVKGLDFNKFQGSSYSEGSLVFAQPHEAFGFNQISKSQGIASLTWCTWEYPVKTQNDLYISQVFLASSSNGELIII